MRFRSLEACARMVPFILQLFGDEKPNHVPAGKQWHAPRSAFRPSAGLSSYEKRKHERVATAAMKAKEKEMKDEKEAERQVCTLPSSSTQDTADDCHRDECKPLKRKEQPRKSVRGTRSWPRRCTRSESSV
jgi:hypothetical protein